MAIDHYPENGQPVENRADEKEAEVSGLPEETKERKHKKSKKFIIAAVIVLLVAAAAAAIGVVQFRKKEAEKLRQEYSENLELISVTMLSGAGDAEKCGNLIKKVWYNSIYEERDSTTDQYTRPYGYFVSDFNDALVNLFVDSDFNGQIEAIEENQELVKSLMKELKNPPEEFEDAYEALAGFYEAYLAFTNLVISPSGSLQTFSSNFNDADSKVFNCYKTMELYLED